jgi:heme/copper-type cytochrome/quinol oxidase subunit 4
MVTTFSSLLPLSRCISLSLSFALHATSGLSSRTALPILLYYYPIFFSLFFFFPVKKTNNGGTQCNNNLFSFIIIINIIIRILRAYGTSI